MTFLSERGNDTEQRDLRIKVQLFSSTAANQSESTVCRWFSFHPLWFSVSPALYLQSIHVYVIHLLSLQMHTRSRASVICKWNNKACVAASSKLQKSLQYFHHADVDRCYSADEQADTLTAALMSSDIWVWIHLSSLQSQKQQSAKCPRGLLSVAFHTGTHQQYDLFF